MIIFKTYRILLLFSICSFSQSHNYTLNIHDNYEYLRSRNINALQDKLSSLDNNLISAKTLRWELKNLKEGFNDELLHKEILETSLNTIEDSLILNLHLGEYYIYNNQQGKAYNHFLWSLEKSKQISDSLFACKSLTSLLEIIRQNRALRGMSLNYLNEYEKYAYNDFEKAYYHYYRNYFSNLRTRTFNIDSLKKEYHIIKRSKSEFCLLKYYQRVGTGYDIYIKNIDSCIYYYNKALTIIDNGGNYDYLKQFKKGILNNKGCTYYDNEKYRTAALYFNKALKISSSKKRLLNDSIILNWLVKTYKKLGQIDSAFFYYKKKDSVSQLLSQLKYAAEIKESYARYNFIEAEKDKLILDKKRIINKTAYTILALILTTIIFISVIGYRSLKRRQRLIESQKEVQSQKLETLLKEQELLGIDAMIEGQEKERQRIANDLHDNLGSLLATLKLYIQNFRIRKDRLDDEYANLITKTDELLDEAYQEVRKMAHVKNAGVPSKEGLVQAIRNFASKVSVANSLIIEVEDFGMDLRLDNSLEISVFRIIQELITNVIKHAEANEVSIQLTHHNDFINIIVEDNGKGFKIEDTEKKEGMGLHSIEKRISYIKGTISIDSSPGYGTTISIDIPIISVL